MCIKVNQTDIRLQLNTWNETVSKHILNSEIHFLNVVVQLVSHCLARSITCMNKVYQNSCFM